MDALEAIGHRRPLARSSPKGPARPTDEQLKAASRLTWQLPVLLSGRWSAATPLGNADAAIRLQAALWEVAARRQVAVAPDDTVGDVADRLVDIGGLAPAAATAARLLAPALAQDGFDETACRLAGRLIAHLELRARYG